MRVLQVIAALAPEFGGPVQTCTESAEALAALGHDVRVVTTDRGAGRRVPPQQWTRQQRGLAQYAFHRALSSWGPELAPGFAHEVLKARRYDIVEVYGAFNAPATGAMALLRALRVPYVVRPLGTLTVRSWKKRAALRVIEAANLSAAARVIFSSELEMHQALTGGLNLRGAVIPEGVATEPSWAVTQEPAPQRDYLLYLGRIHRQKGFDVLLPAFVRVAKVHPELALVIAGPDSVGYRRVVEESCRALGIDSRVRFMGPVYGGEKQQLLAGARGLVLPSHSESFGRVAIEAAAVGVPSALSDRVGVAASVVRAGAGFTAPLDPEAYACAIERLLAADRVSIRSAALALAASMTWEASARELEALFAEVLRETGEVRDEG